MLLIPAHHRRYFVRYSTPLAFLFLFLTNALSAIAPHKIHYTKKEVMVPMRDGIKLFTRIYIPDSSTELLPILIMRSPYSDWNMGLLSPDRDQYIKNMAKDGYIFVFQNIRGKQKSEGEFKMEGAFYKNNPNGIDEATDTYDLIEWLLKNIPSNGKVGQLGISYPGELTLMSAVRPHPALKAVSPQGTVADFFMGDDYFHNGAFRFAYSFEYAFSEEASKKDTNYPFSVYDLFDWYLNIGPLSNVNTNYFHNKIPTWNDFVHHPNYDSYWSSKAPINFCDTPVIPTLHVGGYWDEENMNGPQALYSKIEKYDTKNYNFLVLGPWCHGQWADSDATFIQKYNNERNTANDFREIQKRWFDFWLKGIGDGKFPEAICYQTGSNLWKQYDRWPDKSAKRANLYLQSHKGLSFKKPIDGDNEGFDTYISDPENPIPYRPRPIEFTYSDSSDWDTWLAMDQRFVDHRPDMLSYMSPALDSDLTITGDVVAHLFAATTGTDADWVVKLIDVYPDNYLKNMGTSQYELIIATDIFRARFRKSFSKPEPLTPHKVDEYTIGLHQVNHVFKKGHKIMVQVQSSWFPIYDLNPQTYIPNIFLATARDFIKATQYIYHNKHYATFIELPIVSGK